MATPLRPTLGNLGGAVSGSPTGAGIINGPLSELNQHSVLMDSPPGFANAPNPLESDASLGILSDTLPSMRLEPVKPKRNILGPILGIAGDAMRGYAGQAPIFTPYMMQQQELEAEDNRFQKRLEAEQAARRARMLDPRIEQVGNTVGWLDPSAGSYNPIFTAPQNFEIYARELGLTPGTPEYVEAIKEFRAGTWNDAGVEGRLTVQRPRLEQSNTNNLRTTSTSRANNIRSTGQSNTNNIRTTNQSNVNNLRSNETTRGSAGYHGRGGKGSGARAVAANGEPIIVRGGRWVYEKTGQPVN